MKQSDLKKAANANVSTNHKKSISDPTYPKYHLRAPSGWINDPCGLFYFNSSFHVFCQSNPWGSNWGEMSWSHMVSHPNYKDDFKFFYPKKDDLFDVTAIVPSLDEKAADSKGIFTGCVKVLPFIEQDQDENLETNYYPTAFYSAVWGSGERTQEVICIARALDANKIDENNKIIDPYLTNWTKYSVSENQDDPKVVLYQPTELDLVSFRDPFIFTLPEDDSYYMIVSAGFIDANNKPRGIIMCFENSTDDLTQNWNRVNTGNNFFFESPVDIKDSITNGGGFECGVLFRLTDHIGAMNDTPYILIFSQDAQMTKDYARVQYYVLGNIVKTDDSMKFEPLESFKNADGSIRYELIDLSPDFIYYAANVMPIDSERRNFLMGWLNINSASQKDYAWRGSLSLPRFLFAYKDKSKWNLGQENIFTHNLRDNILYSEEVSFDKKQEIILDGIVGRHFNLEARFKCENLLDKEFGIKIAINQDNCVDIKITKGYLSVDQRNSCKLDIDVSNKELVLDIFLDGSSLEIFLKKDFNNTQLGFATYSTQLKNTGNIGNELASIYSDKSVSASVNAYSMQSCWVDAPSCE